MEESLRSRWIKRSLIIVWVSCGPSSKVSLYIKIFVLDGPLPSVVRSRSLPVRGVSSAQEEGSHPFTRWLVVAETPRPTLRSRKTKMSYIVRGPTIRIEARHLEWRSYKICVTDMSVPDPPIGLGYDSRRPTVYASRHTRETWRPTPSIGPRRLVRFDSVNGVGTDPELRRCSTTTPTETDPTTTPVHTCPVPDGKSTPRNVEGEPVGELEKSPEFHPYNKGDRPDSEREGDN